MRTDGDLILWADFVAGKFSKNHDGWVYSRDLGGLEHIRYRSDHTGWNHWTKRYWRAIKKVTPGGYLSDSFLGGSMRKRTLKGYFIYVAATWRAYTRLDSNLPDGQINGILTHWEEDGEYIALFQPRVGMKVLDFLRADPENEYAKAILAEMRACAELSWPNEGE